MVVAVTISVLIGLPLGVLAARSQLADNLMRPFLDGMQTMPSFVYLLPGILFLRLGETGRHLRHHHLRGSAGDPADQPGDSAGAHRNGRSRPLVRRIIPAKILTTVQIPMALPTIMAGINQTTLMALAYGDYRQHGGRRRF